jgi:hypothetical protein
VKLVLFSLVLLSSAVSSNCEIITIEIFYDGNECKFLNKLIMQPTSITFKLLKITFKITAAVHFFNCKNVMVTPVQEFVDLIVSPFQEFVDVVFFFRSVQEYYYIHVNNVLSCLLLQ